MASVFSRILAGEIPAYRIAEDDRFYAFLDIRPLKKGHSLVIPKQEVDYIFDMEEEQLLGLTSFARRVAQAIKQVVPCTKVGMAVIGLEVPHAHIHLVPIDAVGDLNFKNPPMEISPEEMSDLTKDIAAVFR